MEFETIRSLIKEYNNNTGELNNTRYILKENIKSISFPNGQFSQKIDLDGSFRNHLQIAIDNYRKELTDRNKEIVKMLEGEHNEN